MHHHGEVAFFYIPLLHPWLHHQISVLNFEIDLPRQRHHGPDHIDATTTLRCWRNHCPDPANVTAASKISSESINANIVGSFPNLTIDLIIGLLTYKTLNYIHLKLKQNTIFVDSKLGDRLIGILPLTVSAAVYNNLSTTPFVVPTKPGHHTMGIGTATKITAAVWVHTEGTRILRE